MATRNISTKLAIDGESEYRESITRINGTIRALQSELKLTESAFQNNANSMEALTEKGKALEALQKAQTDKVEKLSTALENAQKALQNYTQEHTDLESKIADSKKAIEQLDSKTAAAGKTWANQSKTVADCEKELERLRKTSGDTSEAQAELEKKISAAKDKMAALEEKTGGAAKSAGELLWENKSLNDQLGTCDAKLAAAEKGVDSWKTQLNNAKIKLNDLNAEVDLNAEYLAEAEKSSDGCATSIDRFGNRMEESASKADELRDALAAAGVIAALKATADAMKACVESSITFESTMAGVAKTTDLTDAELAAMADAIQDMSTRIPATTTEIGGVVEAAGQLGIAKEDLLSFSEVMINLGTATNLTSEEAATALAKFANVTRMDPGNYERLGSVIVDLGNNFATTEADIVSMATRLSSTGAIVGLREPQIMAIATALSSVGIEAEAGGSAISKLLKQFETMVATGSPKLEDFAAVAGMSSEEFSQKWGEDAVGALSLFIDGLAGIDEASGSSVAVLDDLGIKEVRLSNAVMALASSHGILNRAMATADSAWISNTALAIEANTRYATTESKLSMLSNAYDNLKISIGDKLTPAVGDLAEAGTGVLTWAADMIEDSTILVPLLTGCATAIGTLAVGITGYTLVTKAATGVMHLFNAAMASNPVGLIVIGIAALVAGIATFVTLLKDEAIPTMGELTEAAKKLPEAFEDADNNYNTAETNILAVSSAAQSYIDRLRELEEQGTLTDEQQAEYARTVDILRTLLPDVNIELDEQTGLLVGGADALQRQADAWKEAALQQALATKYHAEIEAWAQNMLEVRTNQEQLNKAQAEGLALEQDRKAVQDELNQALAEQAALDEDTTLTWGERINKNLELEETISELKSEEADYGHRIRENKELQDNLTEAIETGTETAAAYEQEVTDAQKGLEDFQKAAEDAGEGVDGLGDSMTQSQEAIQAITDEIKALAEAYKNAYDAAYSSISGQTGLFGEFSAEMDESADSAAKMVKRWQEQAESFATYNENLKKAAEYGLDDRLITEMADGTAESAAYLAQMIREIEAAGGRAGDMSAAADSLVSSINAAFGMREGEKDNLSTTIANIQTDIDKAIEDLERKAAEADFSGFGEALNSAFAKVDVDFQSLGVDCGTGLSQGLSDSKDQVYEAGSEVGKASIDGGKASVESHSPSKAFYRLGEDCDTGMEMGLRSKIPEILAAAEAMGQQLTTQMQISAKQAVDAFDQEYARITERTSSICASIVPAAAGAASGLPGAMQNIGVQSVVGMINGLRSRSSALYSTIRGIVSNAIASAQNAAAVHSPSEKTTRIFEFVGDGMILGLENRRQKIKETAQSVVNDVLSLDMGSKMKDITESIDTRIPVELNPMTGATPASLTGQAPAGNVFNLNLTIEHFENNSDRDLDSIVDYIDDSLQSRFSRKEAAL